MAASSFPVAIICYIIESQIIRTYFCWRLSTCGRRLRGCVSTTELYLFKRDGPWRYWPRWGGNASAVGCVGFTWHCMVVSGCHWRALFTWHVIRLGRPNDSTGYVSTLFTCHWIWLEGPYVTTVRGETRSLGKRVSERCKFSLRFC